MKFTKKQLEIINSNSKNILVSASAGTGKTTVMVERIAQIIKRDSEIKPEDILVVTFSNASAKDMKTRILNRLEEENIFISLDSKNISTLHALCKNIIEENADIISGLDYDFELIDTVGDKLLKNELVFNFLETKRYDQELLVIEKSLTKNTEIEDMLLDLYEKYNPYSLSFNADVIKNMEETIKESISNHIKESLWSCLCEYEKLINLTREIPHPKLDNLLEKMDDEFDQIAKILNGKDVNFKGVVRFPAKSPEFDEMKDMRKNITDKVKSISLVDLDSELEDVIKMKDIIVYLFNLVVEFSKYLQDEYISRNKLNFNMLEDLAIEILRSRDFLTKKYIFVDEFQDTSDKQNYLINLLTCKDSFVFKIGDLKQSIYAFRGSDSEIFKKSMENADVFTLNENFRSNTRILNYVNDVFNKIDAFDYKGENLVGVLDGGEVAVFDLTTPDKLLKSAKDEIELENLINLIKNEVKFGTKYGDITVLCRKLGSSSSMISKAFKMENIPFKIEKTVNVLDTYEARVFISLMRATYFDKKDINIDLVSIAHLGLFEFDDSLIVECKGDYNLIFNNEKFLSFRNTLNEFKKDAVKVQIRKMLKLSNFYDFLYFRDDAVNNVEVIIDYILSQSFKSMYQVITHLEKLIKLNIEINAPIRNSRGDEVLITTIHRSKGLEFDTVIIPFAGDSFSKNETSKEFIFDKKLGLGFDYMDKDNNYKKLFFKNIIKENIKDEQELEELRLLYVALTRAKRKLIIQGFKENKSLMQYV